MSRKRNEGYWDITELLDRARAWGEQHGADVAGALVELEMLGQLSTAIAVQASHIVADLRDRDVAFSRIAERCGVTKTRLHDAYQAGAPIYVKSVHHDAEKSTR